MTLYYDSEKAALVENHGEEYADFDADEGVGDEDGLVFDLSEPRKCRSLVNVALAAARDGEVDVTQLIENHIEEVGEEDPEEWGWRRCIQQAITCLDNGEVTFGKKYIKEALGEMEHDKEVGAKDYVQRAKSELEHEKGSSDRAVSFLETGLREGGEGS